MSRQRNVLDDTWWPVYLVAGAIDWYGSKDREKTEGEGRRGKVCSLLVKYARSFSPLCVDFIQSYLIFIVVPRVAGYSIQRYEGTRATFNYRRARGPSYVHLALQTRYQRLYAKRLHAPEKLGARRTINVRVSQRLVGGKPWHGQKHAAYDSYQDDVHT